MDIYSSGLSLLATGVPSRPVAAIDGTIMTVGTIVVVFFADSFLTPFGVPDLGVVIAATRAASCWRIPRCAGTTIAFALSPWPLRLGELGRGGSLVVSFAGGLGPRRQCSASWLSWRAISSARWAVARRLGRLPTSIILLAMVVEADRLLGDQRECVRAQEKLASHACSTQGAEGEAMSVDRVSHRLSWMTGRGGCPGPH